MKNKEYITSASNLWMDLLKRKSNLSKVDLESVEELIKSVIKSTIEFKDGQMNLLLDAIDHVYLQLNGDYGDLSYEVADQVKYLKSILHN